GGCCALPSRPRLWPVADPFACASALPKLRLMPEPSPTPPLSPATVLLEQQVEAINRFPDQNPNPVMRVSRDGRLLYANSSSEPIRLALGVEIGDMLPAHVLEPLWAKCHDRSAPSVEVIHQHRTFSVLPVFVEDLDFMNVYGTDITAEKVVER